MEIIRSKDWWLSKGQSEPEIPIGAGGAQHNFASVYKPTLAERFWRRLGYRYHLVDLPPEADGMPGWAITRVRLHLSFLDRLRFLVSGNMRVDVRQGMSERVTTVISAVSIEILRPGAAI